jgi:hypothetical protein
MKAFAILAVVAGALGFASAASAAPDVQSPAPIAASAYRQVQYGVYDRHEYRHHLREMRERREWYRRMHELRRREWRREYRPTYWHRREEERRMHAAHERWRERHYG